jgi:hypothetical protein
MKNKLFLFILLTTGLLSLVSDALADWSAAKRLTWTSGDSCIPAMAADSGSAVHVAWYDGTAGNAEIYYRKSDDGGSTWSASQRLTWTSGESQFPDIATDSGNAIHVVWSDDTPGAYEIYYRNSDDGGSTWSPTKRLTWTSGESLGPDIAIDSGDSIHVVWHDGTPGNAEIYYKQSTDGGTTWSPTKRLTWTSGHSLEPAMAASPNNILHIAWLDYTPGNYEIYYKKSAPGGTTWSAAQRITWTSGYSFDPTIDIDSENSVHVVWRLDTPDHMDLYYKKSPDGGETWSPLKRLTWTSVGAYSPAVDIDSNDSIQVVWSDDTPGYAEIYYKSSADGGLTWSASQRITWTSGDSYSPAMVIDPGDNIHVAWQDDTPGNFEIYYRKGN